MPAQAAFSFELQGLKELDSMLKQLPKRMGKTVLRNALKKAAIPIRDAAKANVPRGPTGNLEESITIATQLKKGQRRRKIREKDTVEMFVGSTAPHAHLVEFGTVERFRKGGGATGEMPASPFLTNAWDATKNEALDILRKEILTELVKAAERLRKRAIKGTLGKRMVEELL